MHTYVRLDPSLPVRPRLSENAWVAAGETLRLEIPLVTAVKVHGRVQTKDGRRPVANAEISLGYGSFRQSDNVVTDQDGRFEGRALAGLVRAYVIVPPDGYVQLGEPWAESYKVPADAEEFELPTIEVVRTHKVAGRLIDDNGEALAATQVLAIGKNRRYAVTVTDSEGRFAMNVPEGVETRIEVWKDERGPQPVTVVEREPLVIRLSGNSPSQAAEAEHKQKPGDRRE